MKMLVQSVVSLAFLCSTPHFLSAQSAAIGEYLGVLFSADRRVALHDFTKPESGFRRIFFQDPEGQDLYLDLKGYGPSGSSRDSVGHCRVHEQCGMGHTSSVQGVATYSALENGSPRYSISVPASLPTIYYFSAEPRACRGQHLFL